MFVSRFASKLNDWRATANLSDWFGQIRRPSIHCITFQRIERVRSTEIFIRKPSRSEIDCVSVKLSKNYYIFLNVYLIILFGSGTFQCFKNIRSNRITPTLTLSSVSDSIWRADGPEIHPHRIFG